MALSWSMDKIGPMCRSAEDCGIVLQGIAGKDDEDPASAGKSFYFAPKFARALKDVVIAYAPADYEEWADPATRPLFERALQQIKELGVQSREARLPDFPYGALTNTIITTDGACAFESLIESGKVDELADKKQIAGLKAGLETPAKEYLRAMRIRSLIQAEMRKLFAEVDILVTPTRVGPAPRITEPLDGPRPQRKDRGMSAHILAGNLAGLPALSLPCGFVDNLPVAISLVGRPFSEGMLLNLGREYQARTDWHRRRPPAA